METQRLSKAMTAGPKGSRRSRLLPAWALLMVLLPSAACKNQPAQRGRKAETGVPVKLRIRAFPPDANLRLEFPGSAETSNAPVELQMKARPLRIIVSRRGYRESTIENPSENDLEIDLLPDEEQARVVFDQADTVDGLMEYLVLYPTRIGPAFYGKLESLMRAKSSPRPVLPLRANAEIALQPPGFVRIFTPKAGGQKGPSSETYELQILDRNKKMLFLFPRHPQNLLALTHHLQAGQPYLKETSLCHLLWSECDCFNFKVIIMYTIRDGCILFQEVEYQLPDKMRSSMFFYAKKVKIGMADAQDHANRQF